MEVKSSSKWGCRRRSFSCLFFACTCRPRAFVDSRRSSAIVCIFRDWSTIFAFDICPRSLICSMIRWKNCTPCCSIYVCLLAFLCWGWSNAFFLLILLASSPCWAIFFGPCSHCYSPCTDPPSAVLPLPAVSFFLDFSTFFCPLFVLLFDPLFALLFDHLSCRPSCHLSYRLFCRLSYRLSWLVWPCPDLSSRFSLSDVVICFSRSSCSDCCQNRCFPSHYPMNWNYSNRCLTMSSNHLNCRMNRMSCLEKKRID